MRKLLLAGFALVALGDGASAADLAPLYKAPPVVAYYDWTGFYVGGNAGYSVGRDPTRATAINANFGFVNTTEAFALAPAGWLGGVQLGYNWQTGHVVIGVEADWQWTGQRDQACVFFCTGPTLFNGGLSLTEEQKLDWFATARGRIGYAADHWLWYVTGGIAVARLENNRVFTAGVSTQQNPNLGTVTASSVSFNRTGIALGTGVETALWGNWTAKLEYLFLGLGSTTDTFGSVVPGFLGPPQPVNINHASDIRDHIIRVGLNYRFGGGDVGAAPGPVGGGYYKAPYYKAPPVAPPPYGWTGVYVGGNLGYSVGHDPATATLLGVQNIVPPVLNQESFTLAPEGWLGGGQLGFNWQTGHLVLGAEADWQWSGQQDSACINNCQFPIILTQKLKSFGTARGRVGYAADAWLWYVTGGAAWGRVSNAAIFPPFGVVSFDQSKSGWVVGGGVETALWGNWTAKLEYLYMDLGSATGSANFVVNPTFVPGPIIENVTATTTTRDHIFRAGLNYKFGSPVVAAY
jgi:outer membrane immunogenic protein